MTKTRPTLAELRHEIRNFEAHERAKRNDDPMHRWIRRHHPRICDYLAAELQGYEELSCWRIAYSALHEMLGAVFLQPRETDLGNDEKRIWATFDPGYFVFVHFPVMQCFSCLPDDFSPRGFEQHYAGFFHFLASIGMFDEAHARRLEADLHDALWGEALGVA